MQGERKGDIDSFIQVRNYNLLHSKNQFIEYIVFCLLLLSILERMTECKCTKAEEKLIKAIRAKDLSEVESLLTHELQRININFNDGSGATPLIFATLRYYNNDHRHRIWGHSYRDDESPSIILILLNHGADPNITDITGSTALHYACRHGNFLVMELLLKFNANVNFLNENGRTPLDFFLISLTKNKMGDDEFLQCIRFLLDINANVTINGILCLLTSMKFVERVFDTRLQVKLDTFRLLLVTKVDVNFQLLEPWGRQCIKGDTILHCAAREMNKKVIDLILECCNPNFLIRNNDNETAYDIAQRLHCKPIMECLKVTLVLQCHVFLRQKWIQMKPTLVTNNEKTIFNKRQKKEMISD